MTHNEFTHELLCRSQVIKESEKAILVKYTIASRFEEDQAEVMEWFPKKVCNVNEYGSVSVAKWFIQKNKVVTAHVMQ